MSSPSSGNVTDSTTEMLSLMRNFSSSMQRMEGHCALMDERTTSILNRVDSVEHKIEPLAQHQADMDARLTQLFSRVAQVEHVNGLHQRGEVDGGGVAPSARAFASNKSGSRWMCPICRSGVLMRAASLKGHIRKLLPGKSSTRPKCFWKPLDAAHQLLVARFEGSTFAERCTAMVRTFYSFLQAATSSSHSESETSDLITGWLTAVLSTDGRPLPVLPHCSSSSGGRRPALSSSDAMSSN